MASLLRFKLLATQCGVAQSPTLSPRTSPVVQIRRRKTTLRMLLGRNSGRRSPRRRDSGFWEKKKSEKDLVQRNTLKDLFVSSPPPNEVKAIRDEAVKSVTEKSQVLTSAVDEADDGVPTGFPTVLRSPGPVWTGFRYRLLLKRAWRPMLTTIPE